MQEDFLEKKLNERRSQGAFRQLRMAGSAIDFCSNDYLGVVTNKLLEQEMRGTGSTRHGSTGSRLLSGNYPLIEELETGIAAFHLSSSALLFNSGYDANIGLLSAVPQRGDTVLYDYLSHASIRDGIRLSFADAFSFGHNDLNELEDRLKKARGQIFVVTESVFSMDGDLAPLLEITVLCERYGAALIVDEAHATGVIGVRGEGLVQQLGLQQRCFARVHTFGKALGCHGAVVLGSRALRDYLINFSRSFIYTTSLPESSVAAIAASYRLFPAMHAARDKLSSLIALFRKTVDGRTETEARKALKSSTPIQALVVPGNDRAKQLSASLAGEGFDVRAILYPTVPKGSERLRVVLHSFNDSEDLSRLLQALSS